MERMGLAWSPLMKPSRSVSTCSNSAPYCASSSAGILFAASSAPLEPEWVSGDEAGTGEAGAGEAGAGVGVGVGEGEEVRGREVGALGSTPNGVLAATGAYSVSATEGGVSVYLACGRGAERGGEGVGQLEALHADGDEEHGDEKLLLAQPLVGVLWAACEHRVERKDQSRRGPRTWSESVQTLRRSVSGSCERVNSSRAWSPVTKPSRSVSARANVVSKRRRSSAEMVQSWPTGAGAGAGVGAGAGTTALGAAGVGVYARH